MKKQDIINLFNIQTERLMIRVGGLNDAEKIQRAKESNATSLKKWMSWTSEEGMSMQGTIDFLNLCTSNTTDICILGEERTTGNLALISGYSAEDEDFQSFITGWWLAAGCEGKGLAYEGMTAILDSAHHKIKSYVAKAGFYEGNIRSKNLIERLGFQQVSHTTKNHTCHLDGSLMDTFDYELRWKMK